MISEVISDCAQSIYYLMLKSENENLFHGICFFSKTRGLEIEVSIVKNKMDNQNFQLKFLNILRAVLYSFIFYLYLVVFFYLFSRLWFSVFGVLSLAQA